MPISLSLGWQTHPFYSEDKQRSQSQSRAAARPDPVDRVHTCSAHAGGVCPCEEMLRLCRSDAEEHRVWVSPPGPLLAVI